MFADAHSSASQRRTVSLRLRLTIWVVAVFVLIQLITGFLFWWIRRSDSDRLFRDRLDTYATTVAQRADARLPRLTAQDLDAMGRQGSALVEFPWIEIDIVDGAARSLVRPETRAPDAVMALLEQREAQEYPLWVRLENEETAGIGAMIAVGVPLEREQGDEVIVVVLTTDALYLHQSNLLLRVFLSAGLLGVMASAISGWLIAGIAVAPLVKLSEVAERLRPETIDEEIDVGGGGTELVDLSHDFEEARSRIHDAFAAQERFLSNVSHEIKTPIATLMTLAQTIRRDGLTDEGREFVEFAEDEMRKLGSLVESFLMLTRVRNGGKPAHLKPHPANELTVDAVEDCAVYAEEYNVRLRLMLDDAEDSMDAVVRGDAALLRTLLSNIIRNAVRFAPAGTAVDIRTELRDGSVHIHIRDQGPGLPEEIIPNIFDRFVQTEAEVTRERGHGLGLAIAKGIAELHNGDISATNAEDGGAVFSVRLPLSAAV